MDYYSFYTGQSFNAHEYLGAHKTEQGVVFRTFAPGARGVGLLHGGRETPMRQVHDGNFYEVIVPDARPGDVYEYRIYTQGGAAVDHCDPYGFAMELRPAHRSIVYDPSAYTFGDSEWMARRDAQAQGPLNIYEMHLGSWRKKGDGAEDWYSYEELAPVLSDYLKESGYNYVEFLPVSEHPCDESWGYQNTGFFAPTSRYGTPDGLKRLIDTLHRNGIGVLLDFVPVHFAVDAYGLAQYDGTALYEYPHRDVGASEWGSCNFMHSRGEVRSFLQSAAQYWLGAFHFDGLRMDAISRILYWQGDERRGVNGNGVAFLRDMNRTLKQQNPGCMLIAEDSTNFAGVTKSAAEGGLGFDYKWDMGWMHDTLSYFQMSPEQRREQYHKLTFSMMYFHSERYLLPFSHDEVVHGKATILQKMNGDYDGKFPQGRALYLYMTVHPGKKLNFMGNEIGQLREWDEKREQDWMLRAYPLHDGFYHYMAELNRLYQTHSALYEWDYEAQGFTWLDCHQEGRCLYAIERRSGTERLAAIFNFSAQTQEGYTVAVPGMTEASALLYSDWEIYGGTTPVSEKVFEAEGERLTCTLAPFSGLLLAVK